MDAKPASVKLEPAFKFCQETPQNGDDMGVLVETYNKKTVEHIS